MVLVKVLSIKMFLKDYYGINPTLAGEVREILDENKAERHIRGGMATKMKYINLHKVG